MSTRTGALTYVNLGSHPHLDALVKATVLERDQALDFVHRSIPLDPEDRLMVLGIASGLSALGTVTVPDELLDLTSRVAVALTLPKTRTADGRDPGEGQ